MLFRFTLFLTLQGSESILTVDGSKDVKHAY